MKRSKHAHVLVVAALGGSTLLSACGNKYESDAKRAVAEKLIDPSSAQFSNVSVYPGNVVCGEVNAKNQLGGYTGRQVFVYNGDHPNEARLDADQATVDYWCSHNNVNASIAEFDRVCKAGPTGNDPSAKKENEDLCKKVDALRARTPSR